MGSYINTLFSANFRTVLVISHERFLYFFFSLCALLTGFIGDVAQLENAPIIFRQHLNQTLMTFDWLFDHCQSNLSKLHTHSPDEAN